MKTKENISKDIPINKYRIEFGILALFIFATIFFARIHEMGGFFNIKDILHPSRHIVGYLFCVLPFLVLSFMATRWSCQNRNFTRQEFVCRVLSVLPIYLAYLYVARYMAALAATVPGELIGAILYPLSTPLIPFVFRITYAICLKEYLTVYPEEIPKSDKTNVNNNSSVTSQKSLAEMFRKSHDVKK